MTSNPKADCVEEGLCLRLMMSLAFHASKPLRSSKPVMSTLQDDCSDVRCVIVRYLCLVFRQQEFSLRLLATCLADTTVKIWSVGAAFDYKLEKTLVGHQ